LRALDRILDGRVDLVLDRTFFCPAGSHVDSSIRVAFAIIGAAEAKYKGSALARVPGDDQMCWSRNRPPNAADTDAMKAPTSRESAR
jgi:hypothetical protein